MASEGLTTSPDDLVPIDYGSPETGGWPVPRLRRRTVVAGVVAASVVGLLLAFGGGGLIDRLGGRPTPLPELDLTTTPFAFDDRTGTIDDVPAKFRALDGQRVRFTGHMYQPEVVDGPPPHVRCQLVAPGELKRRFRPPLVQDRVFATLRKDLPIYDQYTPVHVTGRLRVRPVRDAANQWIVEVFRMEVESATPADGQPTDGLPSGSPR